MRTRLRQLANGLRRILGPDEIALALALGLIATGFTQMPSWDAGAYLAPGLVLLWIFVPTRRAFVVREPGERRR